MIYVTFEVEGSGVFPFDMLRFDRCYPLRPEDAANLAEPEWRDGIKSSTRRVRLQAAREAGQEATWLPTMARWWSFGWSVDRGSITER